MSIYDWVGKIHCGDAYKLLKLMPSESVDVCITSPPYYGLRVYGENAVTVFGGNSNCEHEWGDLNFCVKCGAWRGQLGLEPSYKMYVEHLVELFREVKRVLKKTGSLWLNIGDTYAGSHCGRGDKTLYQNLRRKRVAEQMYNKPSPQAKTDLPPKCLMGIPWRVALAMIDDGWILRNAVIWYKPNAMPSSVKDRLTQTYEYIFHFVKSRKYYYNLDNIRVPHITLTSPKIKNLTNQRLKEYEKVYEEAIKKRIPHDIKGSDGNVPESLEQVSEWNKEARETMNEIIDKLNVPEEIKAELKKWWHDHQGQPKGGNPGDVFNIPKNSKFLEADVKTASPAARALKTFQSGKLTTHVKRKILDVGAYLKSKLKESGLTIRQLAEITGIKQTTLEHYFRTDFSGQALPSRETWNILKPILNLGEYDDYINEEVRSALPQPHPHGRNPGDVFTIYTKYENLGDFWSICTRPFKGAHFAVFPPELPLHPILASCPPDGIVLDPLAGSGTVAYTCELINRGMWDEFRIPVNEFAKKVKWNLKWILIEINPDYCKLAEKRLEPFLKQKRLDEVFK